MKRLLCVAVACLFVAGPLLGCTEKTAVKKETKVTTPGGTTTTTTKQEIEKTGDNPPAPQP